MIQNRQTRPTTRRAFLATGVAGTAAALAGCSGSGSGGTTTGPMFEGGNETSGDGGAPSVADLPDLEGDLTVYLGRGEGGVYGQLVDYLQDTRYENFSVTLKRGPSTGLANTILTEAENGGSPADVFWSIDAASLALVADAGLAAALPADVAGVVPGKFRDPRDRWVGLTGRARAIPYNTDVLSASDVPKSVFDIPGSEAFRDALGWAPSYGSFQAFVTAMRVLEGEDRTRAWLNAIQDTGVQSYAGEFGVTYGVANSEVAAGFANHYYALRLLQAKPDAPLDLAFTENDPGALVNVAGALVLDSTPKPSLAANFVRHFLTREIQQYLVEHVYSYPLAPGVAPPDGGSITLPSLDDLHPPDLDLATLANVQETAALLRDTGVL
ncbi:extracellular solute-binding protein [Halocalculus aciditolerans]|uniref:Iron ABC transporter substrate-binding protein n=1 Tax=Halocalculus aciditolerans TaxID=1383812 RepID=A0A830FHH0_9EURY|nr:extracellular solute-binding protein [Halocalculus aciditolerans]GGL55680.1 iron ABC transporter substrate-binding protein [Halocalculus aciditolerans]